jgi:uncharacterized protein (TIGR03435 family)
MRINSARSGSRELLAVGIFGRALLGERIEMLLKRGREFSPRVSAMRVGASGVVLLMLGIASALAPRWIAFAQQPGGLSFEVASVKPSNPGAGGNGASDTKSGEGTSGPRFQFDHGTFRYSDSVFGLIVRAYSVPGCRTAVRRGENCPLLAGGPDWLKRDKFDIQAKTPNGTPDYSRFQFQSGQAPQLQLMLQSLLADRFHLKVHRERKELAVFALTIAKKGPKLKQAEGGESSVLFGPAVQSNGEGTIHLLVKNTSIEELASTFADVLGRPVLDRTGLKGKFDFSMDYGANSDAPGAVWELAGPSLFSAFQEQAGLKFESTRAAVQVLVIDSAEKPGEN